MADKHPCSFKVLCRTKCPASLPIADRPEMCESMECEHYTPCKKCGNNRHLQEGLCADCKRGGHKKPDPEVRRKDGEVEIYDASEEMDADFPLESEVDQNRDKLPMSITLPGDPPPEYGDQEREYYEKQWEQYSGYYRDPTAYAICHNIILIEVELHWINTWLLRKRETVSDSVKAMEKKRDGMIANLEKLRKQLPEKDSADLSDAERSISMIYETYVKEQGLRKQGNVSRILSKEAVALAPQLHFPLDPEELLRRLNYRTVDITEAVDMFCDSDEIPPDPKELLEFMGYYLDEKLANEEPA